MKTCIFVFGFLGCLSGFSRAQIPEAAAWEERGSVIWSMARDGRPLVPGEDVTLTAVGAVDFVASQLPQGVEVDTQMFPPYRNAEGNQVTLNPREWVDPIDQRLAVQSSTSHLNFPPPLDHDSNGNPLGLKFMDADLDRALPFHRMGIRLRNTPPGRLLFLAELASEARPGGRWYAHEYTFPVAGAPWRPPRRAVEAGETHLRKLAVYQLEAWEDPSERIPAKLRREDVEIDFDATSLTWEELKSWMEQNIHDAQLPPGRPFVIQLPPGRLQDEGGSGIHFNKWRGVGKALTELTGGRQIWLVGHPDTVIPHVKLSLVDNIGFLFTRFTQVSGEEVTHPKTEDLRFLVELHGRNLDFRNNWLESPDGVVHDAIALIKVEDLRVLDNVVLGMGTGIGTGGPSTVQNSVIARNWIERGYDGVQVYGGWVDVILAHNHFAGASGYANRMIENGHFGANFHADEFQLQANNSDLHPQRLMIFSNFSQFGRHNWPAQWAEIGGGTQNIIMDSDAYVNTHIFWNIFQNLLPTGHRGIKTISPDKDWVLSNDQVRDRDYIENLSIVGNAFLERLDHNNHPDYGYWRSAASIGGRLHWPFYELLNVENLYPVTHNDRQPAYFMNWLEARPDPEAAQGWLAGRPRLTDVYSNPITYTGTVTEGYRPDFSRTSHAGDKFLEGFLDPLDLRPREGWERSPGGAARLTPASELAKIPPMPVDLAEVLGDAARSGSLFDELEGTPVPAQVQRMPSPWREDAPDDGFVLHVKFGSAGTPGTERELLREKQGDKRYRVFLTRNNTVRFEFWQSGKLLSRVESDDTFRDGDHLTLQVMTPFHPLHPEGYYARARLLNLYRQGLRRIRYVSSNTAPTPGADAEELWVWMNPEAGYRFKEWRQGSWEEVWTGNDSIHANAVRTFSVDRHKNFNGKLGGPDMGTFENLRRDLYPLDPGRVYSFFLDGPGEDNSETMRDGDLRWENSGIDFYNVQLKQGDRMLGTNRFFNIMGMATGRPRCFIRRNIEYASKLRDWRWTPDVDLPRGEVVLFDGFDGSYERFRVIRGAEGQFGAPANPTAYRIMESVAAALAFTRPPLDDRGTVPGWGTPELDFKAE